jgi:hypothetical protein
MSEEARTSATSFQVALQGTVGPALRATFLAMGVRRVRTTSAFLLPAREGEGLCEIVEDLGRRGMTLLDARPAAGAAAATSGRAPPPGS